MERKDCRDREGGRERKKEREIGEGCPFRGEDEALSVAREPMPREAGTGQSLLQVWKVPRWQPGRRGPQAPGTNCVAPLWRIQSWKPARARNLSMSDSSTSLASFRGYLRSPTGRSLYNAGGKG